MTIHEIPRNSTQNEVQMFFSIFVETGGRSPDVLPVFVRTWIAGATFCGVFSGVKTLPKNKDGNGKSPFLIGEYIFKCVFFPHCHFSFRRSTLNIDGRCVSSLDEHVVGETKDRNRSDRVADCFEVWGPWGSEIPPSVTLDFWP